MQLHNSPMLEVASGTFSPGLQFQQEQPLAFAAWFKGPLLCGWPDYLMIKWCGAMTLRHDVMGLVVSPAEIQVSCCCNLITRWFFLFSLHPDPVVGSVLIPFLPSTETTTIINSVTHHGGTPQHPTPRSGCAPHAGIGCSLCSPSSPALLPDA